MCVKNLYIIVKTKINIKEKNIEKETNLYWEEKKHKL